MARLVVLPTSWRVQGGGFGTLATADAGLSPRRRVLRFIHSGEHIVGW
jgi:hypothetical protein